MSWGAQVATWTSNNRYPGIFRTVRARVAQRLGADLGQGRLKILSFGCSNGSELSSLRAYFPDAQLYGCDVNHDALYAAAEAFLSDEALIFESSPDAIRAHGPYDVIFAMSVLCRFPDSMEPKRFELQDLYTFQQFEQAVGVLAGSLRPGGLLVLYNSNYAFADLGIARDFRPVVSPLLSGNGFVDKFDADGARLTWCEMRGRHFVHRPRVERTAQAIGYAHCIFELDASNAGEIMINAGAQCVDAPTAAPDGYLFGPDLGRCVEDATIGVALAYWRHNTVIIRSWCRSNEAGQIERGAAWSVEIESADAAPLTTDPLTFKKLDLNARLRRLPSRLAARLLGRMARG